MCEGSSKQYYLAMALSVRNVQILSHLTLLKLSVHYTAFQPKTVTSISGMRLMLGCCPANKTYVASGKENLTEESCSLAQTGRRAVCEINAAD